MTETPRLDAYMDRKLLNDVYYSIQNIYYHLPHKYTGEPFSMPELIAALEEKGYTVYEDEESVKPYLGYMYHTDYITLVRLKNADCCIRQYHNNPLMIFQETHGGNGITLDKDSLSDTVAIIEQIDNSLPEIIHNCQTKILNAEKKARKISINKATVTSVVKATLKGTGIQYKLDLSDSKATLILRLDNNLETKFYLSYKDFMKKMPYVKSTVDKLNEIMKVLEQPLRIKSTYYREKEIWTESE